MRFEVIPGRWRGFRRGDIVTLNDLGVDVARVDGFRRLGMIQPVTADLPTTKPELLALAESKGVDVPDGEWRDVKPALIELLKE